ncbi:MAG: AraC family transcriptional regulator [Eisenbergiella sp.]
MCHAADPFHEKPLTEIWEDAGFESQRSFNRVFHEAVGMSPRNTGPGMVGK